MWSTFFMSRWMRRSDCNLSLSLHKRNNIQMTNVVAFKKIVIKTRIKNSIFCHFEKIYRKNNNWRIAMTTTYTSTSCNSKNIVACSQ